MEEAGLLVPDAPIAPVPASTPDSIPFDRDVSGTPCLAPLVPSPVSEAIVCCCSTSRLSKTDSTFVRWVGVVRRGCGVGVGGGEGIGEGIGACGLVAAKNSNPVLVSSVD